MTRRRAALGVVWVGLGVACTGAYDRPLPLEFQPGEFVVVQTDRTTALYRVEPSGRFLARGMSEPVSEVAFEGAEGAVLWRFERRHLRWYDPALDDFFEPTADQVLEELSPEAEDGCECPHLVFPDLIPLAPGASCPVPPGMASAFRWDGGEWGSLSGEPPPLFLRRSTREVGCIEKVALEDFIAGPNELPPEPRVISLEAHTATTGVMRGLLQHGEFLYVVGDRGWIALDVETLEVRPEHGRWGIDVGIQSWTRGSPGEALAILAPEEGEVELWAALGAEGPEAGVYFESTVSGGVEIPSPRLARALVRRWFLVLERDGFRLHQRKPGAEGEGPMPPWEWDRNSAALECEACRVEGFEGAFAASFGLGLAVSGGLWIVPSLWERSAVGVRVTAEASPNSAWLELSGGPPRTLARRRNERLALQRLGAVVAVDGVGVPSAGPDESADGPLPDACTSLGSSLTLVRLGARVLIASEAGRMWYLGGERCALLDARSGPSLGSLVDAVVLPRGSSGNARAALLDSEGVLVEFRGEPR